jgi:uncharacterized Ntn-hydrolase superfamily protein
MTLSIVARDPASGELGVAVASHWLSVGSVVPWARPGVGAVATQAAAEPAHGPNGLDLLADGLAPQTALERLLAADPGAASRQVAVVDAHGRAAAHTGAECIPHAGHALGEGVSCQANIMARPSVWDAMRDAFGHASGALEERMVAALEAGEAEGGDRRGRQSASLLVVPVSGAPWRARIDLRVEDHPEPLPELCRVLALHRAYAVAAEADELAATGDPAAAATGYRRAAELAPDSHELCFWAGLAAAQAGELDAGVAQVRAAIAAHPPWRELLSDLPPSLAPAAPAVLARLDPAARRPG